MKINFIAGGCVTPDVLARNKVLSSARGLPCVFDGTDKRWPLAIVGGGPSLPSWQDELGQFPGEIWAVNGAYHWCRAHGIDAAFFTLDPSPWQGGEPAHKAILADCCDPSVFDHATGRIETFPFGDLPNGSTTASTAPMIAARRGHESVTLFACESSFVTREHAYVHQGPTESRVLVTCGGTEYMTTPQLIMQAEYLADVARGVPGYVRVKGEGFLPALIEHGDYDVLKVSRDMAEALDGYCDV